MSEIILHGMQERKDMIHGDAQAGSLSFSCPVYLLTIIISGSRVSHPLMGVQRCKLFFIVMLNSFQHLMYLP